MFLINSTGYLFTVKRVNFCFKKEEWPTMLKDSKRVISIRIRTMKNKRQLDLSGGIVITDP